MNSPGENHFHGRRLRSGQGSSHSELPIISLSPSRKRPNLSETSRSHNIENGELPENVLVDEEHILRNDDFGIAGSEEVITSDSVSQDDKVYPFQLGRPRKINVTPSETSNSRRTTFPVPANVLLTEENLKGNPKVYASVGRPPLRNAAERKKAFDLEVSDPAPNLSSVSEGLNDKVPGMQNFFRVVSESALKKAQQFRLLPPENDSDEPGGVGEIAIAGEIEECTEEILEEIIDSAEIVEINEDDDHNEEESNQQNESRLILDADVVSNGNTEGADFEGMISRHRLAPLAERGTEDIFLNRVQIQQNFEEWPLYWDRPIDFQEACMILTGVRTAPDNKICSSVPQGFRGEGTFVIDLRSFQNRHDVALDGLGSWGWLD